jgi:hypothetical protein
MKIEVIYIKLKKIKIITSLRGLVKEIIKVNIFYYFLINKRKRSRN